MCKGNFRVFCTRSSRCPTLLSSALIALWPSDSGWRYCADAVDTSAARGQRLVPKNTWPLAFLLTVASYGTVLSEPASEQQAGHSNPLFSVHMGLHCHIPWNTTLAHRLDVPVFTDTAVVYLFVLMKRNIMHLWPQQRWWVKLLKAH